MIPISPLPVLRQRPWGIELNTPILEIAAQAQTAEEVEIAAADAAEAKFIEFAVDLEDSTMTVIAGDAASNFAILERAKFGAVILATEFGAVGDGVTDNSAAIAAGLAAAQGGTLYFPPGSYVVSSATRLLLDGNFSSIAGDPSGLASMIRFTHADGGLDIGAGASNVYENTLSNIIITGTAVATKVVRMRKCYEPFMFRARIEAAAATAGSILVDMDDCGQLDAVKLTLANAPIGIRIKGTQSPITNISMANFYNITQAVKCEGGTLSRFSLVDSWVEACPDLIVVDTAGAFSIGELNVNRCRILKASGDQRLFRFVAATALNAARINFDGCYVAATASTAPLFDMTAQANTGTVRFQMKDANIFYANTGTMLQVHASQTWNFVLTDFKDIVGPAPGLWSPTPLSLSWPKPLILHGSGVPSLEAPRGSLYMRNDVAPGFYPALYMKMSAGATSTAWRALGTQRAIVTKTSAYTITDVDEVVIGNGSSITLTLPNPGLHIGRSWTVKNIHSTSLTLGAGTGTIDGAATISIAQWASVEVISNGSGVWLTV